MHITSRQPYWCAKTMDWWPWWCPKPVLWELNPFFCSNKFVRCWPLEWKCSIGRQTPVSTWHYSNKRSGTYVHTFQTEVSFFHYNYCSGMWKLISASNLLLILDLRNDHILHIILSVKGRNTFYTIPIGKHIDLIDLHKAHFCTLAYTIGIIFLVPIKLIIYWFIRSLHKVSLFFNFTILCYPLDRDLFGGKQYPPFEELG